MGKTIKTASFSISASLRSGILTTTCRFCCDGDADAGRVYWDAAGVVTNTAAATNQPLADLLLLTPATLIITLAPWCTTRGQVVYRKHLIERIRVISRGEVLA